MKGPGVRIIVAFYSGNQDGRQNVAKLENIIHYNFGTPIQDGQHLSYY